MQVELARGVNCWPLLQLVSIGCHASCSTLHERMHKMCEPQVQSPQIGTSCTLAHSGKIPPFSPLAIASTPTKEHKPIPFQGTPSPGVPARSPGIGANKKMHTYGIMTYFIAASKPEIQLQQCWGKAKTHEHEYPVQFMAALANTMQRIAEVCSPLSSHSCMLSLGMLHVVSATVGAVAGVSKYWPQDTREHH